MQAGYDLISIMHNLCIKQGETVFLAEKTNISVFGKRILSCRFYCIALFTVTHHSHTIYVLMLRAHDYYKLMLCYFRCYACSTMQQTMIIQNY